MPVLRASPTRPGTPDRSTRPRSCRVSQGDAGAGPADAPPPAPPARPPRPAPLAPVRRQPRCRLDGRAVQQQVVLVTARLEQLLGPLAPPLPDRHRHERYYVGHVPVGRADVVAQAQVFAVVLPREGE